MVTIYPAEFVTFHAQALLILSTEPSTGTVMGQIADCDLQDFQRAIKSAHEVQNTFFSTTTGAARGALLRKWCDLILANKEDGKLFHLMIGLYSADRSCS